MKILLPVFVIVSFFVSVFISGCTQTSSESGAYTLKGVVLDTTVTPSSVIQGALVTMMQSGNLYSTATDSTGVFKFENLSSGDYDLSISKYNYYKYNKIVTVSSDSVTNLRVSLVPKSIYVFNNIVLDEYLSSASYSAANFLTGQRVQDLLTNKDVQLRDTVVGPDTLIYLRSAFLDNINVGKATYFSNSLATQYTKAQFDTLSKFPTIDYALNPYRDFPNTEGMDKFFNNGVKHSICAFYLIGRWQGAAYPRTFGLLYVDSVWYDASQSIRKILVDIKINTNAANEFNPNPSK
jgi:hypothetical protein